jgi:hypothetical protein
MGEVQWALCENIMKPGTSQRSWWTWLQMIQGPHCEGTKLQGLRRKIQRLGRQDILTVHADKDIKRPHNREDRSSILQEKAVRERWARNGPKSPWAGRPRRTGPAHFLWRFEPPFGLGLLRGINSLAAKIRWHPATGTQRNLGESDDSRRESSKLSRRWPRPTLASMAALHGWATVEFWS